MEITKLRNLCNICREKVAIAILLLAFCFSANAQTAKGNHNFLDFQQKPYYFGITLAYNKANFKVFKSDKFINNDSISLALAQNGPGFNLGIVTNLKVGDNFDIRFLPTLSFAERSLKYQAPGNFRKPYQRKIESVFVELPFHARYKSAPYHDLRVFVIGGIKYTFDVASDSRTRQADELVKISPSDFSVELGVGVQFFFPYFIFSPEFKISQGISNILIYNGSLDQSNVIEKLLSRGFTISLHFEG